MLIFITILLMLKRHLSTYNKICKTIYYIGYDNQLEYKLCKYFNNRMPRSFNYQTLYLFINFYYKKVNCIEDDPNTPLKSERNGNSSCSNRNIGSSTNEDFFIDDEMLESEYQLLFIDINCEDLPLFDNSKLFIKEESFSNTSFDDEVMVRAPTCPCGRFFKRVFCCISGDD
ncbi:hypothetical protein SLOPH_1045 [Spraguea lophii 42_110]|uniref:Uncharacterized protein n=1 Tax=Spraguea lophii (strain 42_110) TaxID=1358809 RepID=S7XI29_SPRLO|nr:hypothetical protein SLOPH_1045 [Spraguea lophii 42_110]